MTVTIRYYAQLKQEAGTGQEVLETSAATVDALWSQLAERHGFTLDASLVKAAQLDEFCPWDAQLISGAVVVFMPPVAGG